MSELIMCEVECDGCQRIFGNEPSMERIRARAEKLGWIKVGDKDYCPKCKKNYMKK